MAIWLMTLFFTLLTPALMTVLGFLWKSHPPKEINSVYGYRTAMSCKNQATWDFAHQTAGRLWRGWGLGSLLLSAVIFAVVSLALAHWNFAVLSLPENVDAFSWLSLGLMAVQLVVLVGSIFPVERALKRRFDRDGNVRE